MPSPTDAPDPRKLDEAVEKLTAYQARQASDVTGVSRSTSSYARIAQISQVGMEMAIPAGVGVGLDYWLSSFPWCTIIGALLGPILGFIHLMAILRTPVEKSQP